MNEAKAKALETTLCFLCKFLTATLPCFFA